MHIVIPLSRPQLIFLIKKFCASALFVWECIHFLRRFDFKAESHDLGMT